MMSFTWFIITIFRQEEEEVPFLPCICRFMLMASSTCTYYKLNSIVTTFKVILKIFHSCRTKELFTFLCPSGLERYQQEPSNLG